MKKLLLLFVLAGFYSCKKCADCTTTTNHSFSFKGQSGGVMLPEDYSEVTDPFRVCGGDQIKNQEQTKFSKIEESYTLPYDPYTVTIVESITETSVCN